MILKIFYMGMQLNRDHTYTMRSVGEYMHRFATKKKRIIVNLNL